MNVETCVKCDSATDKAGDGDGSIYCPCGEGPFCDSCWDEHQESCLEERVLEVEHLRARVAELEAHIHTPHNMGAPLIPPGKLSPNQIIVDLNWYTKLIELAKPQEANQ